MRRVFFLFFFLYLLTSLFFSFLSGFRLEIILILYLLMAGIFLLFTFFNLYHAWRFGTWQATNFFMLFIYLVLLAIIIFFSWRYLSQIDWQQSITQIDFFDLFKIA